MKLLHLGDLHLGKRVGEFSLLQDQRFVLGQVVRLAAQYKVDAVLLAGDLYDKPVPPAEAVELLDWFLTALCSAGHTVLAVSGNHDSPERLAFASSLLQRAGVYIAGEVGAVPQRVTLTDDYGPVDITLLPFVKPAMLTPFLGERPANTDAAVAAALAALPPDAVRRNVLVAHQFVTAGSQQPAVCDSEIAPVGGVENVDVSCFNGYDYVALGHLHGPQRIGRDSVRYAGSPLKYSFSEVRHHKSAALVTLGAPGEEVEIELLPLVPLHDMREVRGPIDALLSPQNVTDAQDYLHVTLTDEEELIDAISRVRAVYPNLMKLDFDNRRTRAAGGQSAAQAVEQKTLPQLFSEFFELMNGSALTENQQALFDAAWKKSGGEAQ